MRYIFAFAFLMLFILKGYAQYPFEKFPAIKYDSAEIINHGKTYNHGFYITRSKGFKRIASYKNYKLVFLSDSDILKDGTNALLYHKNHIIKRMCFDNTWLEQHVYIADIDGNGLPDFKIIVDNDGNGFAADYETKVYLFNEGNDVFKLIAFTDLFSNIERDFNHDGNYEIIGQEYRRYKEHAYFIFNLYNFKNGKFVNVSHNYNYPIAIKYLYGRNFITANNMPRGIMKKFTFKKPGDNFDN